MDTRRTIEEVFDIQSGAEVLAKDFFCQPFDVLTQARSEQERANQSKRPKWLVCSTCGENIRILGGKTLHEFKKPGKNFHFAHLHNSKDCPIKTTSKYSREDINRMRYRGIAEGQPHIELKSKLYQGLNLNAIHKGQVTDLQLERVIRSLDENEWRKPDINLRFEGHRLAVELQLSTTWLDVIVGRQEFYRQQGIFILWVFNAFDHKDTTRKLAYSDIIYTNNYNAFIFDEEAREATLRQNDLVLKCYYQHHYAEKDKVLSKWQNQLVSLGELTYDQSKYKVFFKDVEAEKVAASIMVKQYALQQENEKKERRIERNRLRKVRVGLSNEHKTKRQLLTGLETEIAATDKLIQRNAQDRLQADRELTALPATAKSVAEKLDTWWRGLPEPVEELADMLNKREKELKEKLKKFNARKERCKKTGDYYQLSRVKHVDGVEYHVLDRNKEWDFIVANASRLYAYRTDQEKNLFAKPEIQPLNSHKIQQMRYSPQVEFVINFEQEIAANTKEKSVIDMQESELNAISQQFSANVMNSLECSLRNHYQALLTQLDKSNRDLLKNMSDLKTEKLRQETEADELFGKLINLDYLDYYDEEDRY